MVHTIGPFRIRQLFSTGKFWGKTGELHYAKWLSESFEVWSVGPAPLQKCAGDFCCVNFGGFCRGFSWRIFLGTFSQKMRRKNPARKSAKKSGGSKKKIREKSILPKAGPKIRNFQTHLNSHSPLCAGQTLMTVTSLNLRILDSSCPFFYTEQMDAEGLGRKLLLTPLVTPAEPLQSRPWALWQHLKKC